MKIALLGNGAISRYVQQATLKQGLHIEAFLLRPQRLDENHQSVASDSSIVSSVTALPPDVTHLIDCAGHQGLAEHGPAALRAGLDVITVSIGALADPDLYDDLVSSATEGGSRLHLASGAIGALDTLRAARSGQLDSVRYTGRKPPQGWIGSPAEQILDLQSPLPSALTHFTGSARDAALRYPKNANVAAAVALAGVGFDTTEVELIADPTISSNIHEICASGDFGSFTFSITGNSLPDNPRSSALAAMSVVAEILAINKPIRS
ncbi:aspartate dehydrogenase [Parasedimentitalea huanghaiensis]|uniref:L-aspartate dehydrogenase n=1 Tax=Parasedimentitalea huanghaiensis TaxID=2682100 RepID=A0A6L6WM13_9RHOB|nr:aspartate dehydrogenase [Zongyanglinia huanghaiensis]